MAAAAACLAPGPVSPVDAELRCAGIGRSGGGLRRVLAAIAGRLVATRSWERLAFARAGDYARERLGISARELSDLARVDAALRTLPGCEAALVSGALPWTQVRLIARAARPEDEAEWIAFAKGRSVRELERHVRALDAGTVEAGAADPDAEGPREGISLPVSTETHAKWQFGWRLVRRVAGEALPVDQAAEYICAEVLSALPAAPGVESPRAMTRDERYLARSRQRTAARRSAAKVAGTPLEAGGPATLPPLLEALVEGLDQADAFDLDARLRRAIGLEQRREAELGPWLRRVADERLYRLLGYPGLEAYAADRLAISPRKAWALLRIERSAAAGCPALRAAYRDGRLSWVQALALIVVARMSPRCAEGWIHHARRVTVRRLRDDVDRAVLLAERDPEAFARTGGVPDLEAEARLQTGANPAKPEASPLGADRRARLFFSAPQAVVRLFRATVCSVQRRLKLKTPGEAIDAMLEHCFATWIPRRERRHRIYERDGWRCAVPGCGSYRNLHAHHVEYRSHGGSDEDENLVTLCAWHHLRAAHGARVMRITGGRPTRFELGVRPDGPPLAVYRSGDVLL